MTDGFVSYSRRDRETVLPVVRAAEALDRSLWFDGDDIPAATVWRDELAEAIAASDTFVCFLSSHWLRSDECRREYERARELGKRVVPVLLADTPDAPPELAALQWIDARNGAGPQQVAQAVLAAIDVDHDWVREHTMWLARALRWESGGAERSRLLRGKDLDAAEAWLARGGEPPPTSLQQRFIAAGRRSERRRLRLTVVAALTTVALTLVLAGVAWVQARRADSEAVAARRQTAIAEAQLAATRSTAAGTVWAALAFAVEAELSTPEPLPEARGVMADALGRLGRQPARPQGLIEVPGIQLAAWSPTEPLLLTSGDAGLQLWDMPARTSRGTPKHVLDTVTVVDWSPTGALVAVGGYGQRNAVAVYSVADDRPPTFVQRDAPGLITALAWSPDGARLAIGEGDGVRVLDPTGRQAGPSIPAKQPRALSWAPDGKRLAVLDDDNVLQLYDAITGTPQGAPLADPAARIADVAWSPAGDRLAGVSYEHALRLWEVPPSTPGRAAGGGFGKVRWSPDGTTVAGVSDNTLLLWDGRTGRPLGDPVPSNTVVAPDVGWSVDGTLATRGLDDTVRFWTPTPGAPMRLLERQRVNAVSWSPDGRRLATAGDDGTAHVFDARTGAAVGAPMKPAPSSMEAVAWSPRGDRLATTGGPGPVRLWDPGTGAPLGVLPDSALAGAVAWSPDGSRLAAAVGGLDEVRIWDAATLRPVVDVKDSFFTYKIDWSPDGRWLATAAERTVRIWDAQTGLLRGPELSGHEAKVRDVRWAPDGTRLASSGIDATLRRWDVATAAVIGAPTVLQDRTGAVGVTDAHAVDWAPGGAEIVTGDSDGYVRLWGAATGGPVGEPIPTEHDVMAVAYSPDGSMLAAGDLFGVRIWESVSERDACRFALNALGAEGLQAIAGPSAPPLRCAAPDAIPALAPLPVVPVRAG